jgi:DNA-binding Xre family transcriptional regulator
MSFERFLKKEGLHEEVHAAALKRAVALKLHDLMKKNRVNKSAMAAQMRTSRAAIHRLLDPENTSVTLATLNRAARSLGRRVKIELVPA